MDEYLKDLCRNDYEMAIHSQCACNLSGLAHDLHGLVARMHANGVNYDKQAKHPITRLYVAQIVHLAFGRLNAEALPLPSDLPTSLPELVNGLVSQVAEAWTTARAQNKGTEFVNRYPGVKRYVRALAQLTHNGPDVGDWRWQHAYNRAHVLAGLHPFSNTEKLTEEEGRRLLASWEREEQLREEDETMRQLEADEQTRAKELMEGAS